MAFKVQNYKTEQGVPAKHHIVAQVNINKVNKTGVIEINCYFEEDYKELLIQPLKRIWVDIRPGIFDKYFSEYKLSNVHVSVYEAAYKFLSENIEIYKDAEMI